MREVLEIPKELLREIATDSDRIPRLYFADNVLLRRFFWQRLHLLIRLMRQAGVRGGEVLDFGGGSGVLLPTLARDFRRVTLVDLETEEARRVVEHFGLTNVRILQGDVREVDPGTRFDAIVAADVLEHFREPAVPARVLRSWLADRGSLFTSLPTENWVYVLLRRVFGVEKPWDHYHTGYAVEAVLEAEGFVRRRSLAAPLIVPVAPLFLLTMWGRRLQKCA